MDFTYDNASNLLSGDGLSITYDGNYHTTSIKRGDTTLTFNYDASGQHFIKVSADSTLYYGDNYELEIKANGTRIQKAYIGQHSIITDEKNQPRVIHTSVDRLGSVTSLTRGDKTLSDTAQNHLLIQRRHYDVFGRAFNSYNQSSLSAFNITKRGFTGHEHLPEVGLIHMNGRGFDPVLGRFLSVDPFIQAPTNSQSINPYSYIMNNPLSGIDPTGYIAEQKEPIKEQKPVTIDCSGSAQKANCQAANSELIGLANAFEQTSGQSKQTTVFKAGKIMPQQGSTSGVAANATTAGSLPQGGTATIPNIGDLADGLGKELIGALKKGLILYALKPGELADGTLEGAIARGEIDENELILYHYTNSKENLDSIVATQTLRASFGEKNARYGPGQYFTDVHPGMIAAETVAGLTKDDITLGNMSKGQAARLLFGDARKKASLNYYLRIDVGGLPIQNPRPNVYYLPNDKPLDLRGRIKGYGATLDSN